MLACCRGKEIARQAAPETQCAPAQPSGRRGGRPAACALYRITRGAASAGGSPASRAGPRVARPSSAVPSTGAGELPKAGSSHVETGGALHARHAAHTWPETRVT